MRSKFGTGAFTNLKFTIKGFIKQNKIQLFLLAFFALLGIITGILTAIKSGVTVNNSNGYNLGIYSNGNLFCFDLFFSRMLSQVCMLIIISICTLTIFLVPVGYIVHIYRGYLIGFNCTLLITCFGFSGIFTSIIIIFPMQIATTLVFVIYFAIMINRAIQKKKFGQCQTSFLKIFFIFLIVLTLLNLAETLLLVMLNAKTILII